MSPCNATGGSKVLNLVQSLASEAYQQDIRQEENITLIASVQLLIHSILWDSMPMMKK